MKSKKTKIILALLCLIVSIVCVGTIAISASNDIVTEGEMVNIKSDFAGYLVQDTKRIANDGFVGALQYTVYYDGNTANIVTDYDETSIIVYAINTNTERVGTDSNKAIIQSMLDRGYVVVVLDYLNNPNATGHKLDDSAQTFVNNLKTKKYFNFDGSKDSYKSVFVAPSGYNVLLNQVFWEVDKHSVSGTLEKIVENWNTDFKGTKAERFVKWATGETTATRKKVDVASDGTSPVWYNASGAVDVNGLYTKVKYTVAETITDCVKPDGSPLTMDMTLNLVYPTNPEKEVPLLSVSSCWGYPNTHESCYTDLCSHHTGALFRGYAGAVYDYFWQPMARSDAFGYYDGNLNTTGAVTGHHMNYSLHIYNDKLINTAAIRYLRYLALSDNSTYKFDLDAFCTIGLSKGAWFSFLGEEVLQEGLVDPNGYDSTEALETAIDETLASFACKLILNGHSGETRYQAGEDTVISAGTYVGDYAILPGEKQPWLTYDGKEIVSGVQLTYAANGSQEEDVSAGHSPIFAAAHMNDEYNAAYGSANTLANLADALDIPFVFFEVDQLHEYAYYPDMFYGVPTYDAFFDFANYYLQNAPIKVYYTDPYKNDGDISLTDKITVQFSGATTLAEVQKITVTSGEEALVGSWEKVYGGTQWIFHPENMKSGTTYTITVPASLKGDNGVEMAEAYTSQFTTRSGFDTSLEAQNVSYYTFTAPQALPSGMDTFNFRFAVSNDAANVAKLYAVENANATDGALIGSVNLKGAGTYEIDVTKYLLTNAGKSVTLMLKADKPMGVSTLSDRDFSTNANVGTYSDAPWSIVKLDENGNETANGDSAIKVYVKNNEGRYGAGDVFYENVTNVLSMKNILGSDKITKADYGRQIELTLTIFDTTSRTIKLSLNGMTSSANGIMDYDMPLYNITTKAGEWMTITIPYVVYDTDYGKTSSNTKTLYAAISPTGDSQMPIYFSNLTVKETVTDMNVTSAYISAVDNGLAGYKAPEADTPFALYNGDSFIGAYATWKAALGAYVKGYTLKLTSDYTLTNADVWGDFGTKADSFVIDLNGYTVYCENTTNSLIWLKTTSKTIAKTTITLKNGGIVLNDTPIISYESSSSQGIGKKYDVNLENLNVTLGSKAMLTELVSASTIPSSAGADVKISLKSCDVDLGDEDNRATVMLTLLPEGAGALNTEYVVKGGTLTMSHPRWITVQNKATYVDYVKDANGNNMKLYLPSAYAPSVKVSYIINEGYAQFAAKNTVNNVTEYVLETSGDGSTRYGIIPDAYLDANTYPFVLFKEGAFVGAYSSWYSVLNTAQNTVGDANSINTEVQIVLRRDYKNVSDPGPQINKATNILIDLGGHALITEDVGLDFSANYSTAPYATNIEVRNGKILSGRIAFLDGQIFSAATGVKVYNVHFYDVTFGFDSSIGDFWGDMIYTPWTAVASPYGMENNVTYENCTFDLTNYPLTKNYNVFNTSDGNKVLNVNINIVGGEILMDSAQYVNFAKLDSKDTLKASPDENGNYVTLKVKSGVAPISANFVDENGNNRAFTLATDNGTTAVYTLEDNPLATKYGVISSAYADESAYPFALFSEGNFVSAYTSFSKAMDGALGACAGKNAEYVLLMRRDFTVLKGDSSYLSTLNGTLKLDLGGYTMNASWYLFDQYVTTGHLSSSGKFTIANGSIVRTNEIPMFGMNQGSSSSTHKKFDFTFDNVKFSTTHGSPNGIIFDCWDNNNLILDTKIAFVDCTFDFTGAANGVTMIKAGASKVYTDMDITVKGGKIIANDLSKYNMYALGSEDSIIFVANANGEYTKLITPNTTTPTTTQYPSDRPNSYFVEMEDDGVNSTYYLTSMKTEYGTVAHSTITSNPGYLSAIDFPFITFKDGTHKFYNNDTSWQMTLAHVKDLIGGASAEGHYAAIVFRRDYYARSSDANTDFIKRMGGTFIIDLNGYTFVAESKYMLDIYSNDNSLLQNLEIVIKNGTVASANGNTPIGINHADSLTQPKYYGFTFDGVTFKDLTGTATYIITGSWDDGNAAGLDVTLTFNGCTFDFRGSKADAIMIHTGSSKALTRTTVYVNGGAIITESLGNRKLYSIGNDDNAFLGKGSDGKYTILTQSALEAIPTVSFKTEDGKKLSFGSKKVDGEYASYELGTSVETVYGSISFGYYSAEDYPFALFTEGKEFIGGYKDLGSAINAAASYNKVGKFVILARRDSVNDTKGGVSAFQGTMVIDLAGYTVENTAAANYLFDIYVNDGNGRNGGKIIVNNGTIKKTGGNAIVCTNGDSGLKAVATFGFEFNNVTFIATANASSAIIHTWSNAHASSADLVTNVTFNNCIFDYKSSANGIKMITATNSQERTIFNVTVNGGKIIAKTASDLTSFFVGDSKDTLTFGRVENENYTALEISSSVTLPATEYNIENGKAVFVKISEGAGIATYRLRNIETVDIDFAPKMSITLASELVMNVYIPLESVQKFTFNGVTYENLEAIANKKVTVDGNDYYLLKVALGSAEAAKSVELVATLNAGDKTVTATFTFSIPKYATKLIANGNDVEKTLAKDVLAYVKAAYIYFAEFNSEEEIASVVALIDSIIGADYTSAPVLSGVTNTVSPVKSVTLNLDAKPSIRFYVTDTSVEFYADGKKLNTVSGTDANGAYVELDVYAYALSETITYGNGGSYHVSSFTEGAEGTSYETLVKAFVKYTESAAAYRNYVIGK